MRSDGAPGSGAAAAGGSVANPTHVSGGARPQADLSPRESADRHSSGLRQAAEWLALPSVRDPRWLIPRRSRALARAGLSVYQPVTLKARVGWEAARVLSSLGAFGLIPGRAAPAREVWDAVGPYMPAGGSLAIARATHIGRSVALIVAPDGSPAALAKLATDQEGRDALAREVKNLGRLGTLLSPPLSAPDILGSGDGLLVVRPVPWRARWRSWRMPEDVAFALGAFFRAGSRVEVGGCMLGPSHGDVAPWNFLDTGGGWLLIDWESADETRTPFYDLMHFFVESYSLLRRPSRKTLVSGLLGGRNWIGAAIAAYARGAGIPASETRPHFLAYLQDSLERVDPRGPAARREVEARHQILHDLSR